MNRIVSQMVNKRLTSLSTTATYEPYTNWMPAVGVDAVRALLVAREMLGELDWQFAMQTAAVDPSRPGAWAALGTAQTTAVPYCTGNTSIAASVSNKMWVRFGVKYNRGATPAYAQADLGVQSSLVARGSILGRMPAMTAMAMSTSDYQTLWTTKWVPAEWVDTVRAGIWVGGSPGVTRYVQLAYQTAAVRPSNPDDWSALTGGTTYSTANDYNTGELPNAGTPFAASMWVRFGIQYKAATVGTAVTVGALIGIRRT